MSPETAVEFPVFMLLPFSIAAVVMALRVRNPRVGAWTVLATLSVVAGIFLYANAQIIAFNLHAEPVHVGQILLSAFGAAALLVVVVMLARRGTALPERPVVSEEVHGSPGWALLFGASLTGFLALSAMIPDTGVRLGLLLGALLFLALSVATYSGFHYCFTHAGLEVRVLGLRLQSVPKENIRQYDVADWSWIRGYGIRGVGANVAYVWCNTGVRVQTQAGSIFLGHAEPQRLVRDLDVLTGTVK
jgi:hypothetical protein